MKIRLHRKTWLHVWIRHPAAYAGFWPVGFWRGNGGCGLALGRLNLMLTYPR